MTIEEIIGVRIAAARKHYELTQVELGRRLTHLLNVDWTRQAVWAAEQGKRSFTAVEMVAFANVLSVTVEHLMTPLHEQDLIDMPSGQQVDWFRLVESPTAMGAVLRDMQEDLGDAREQVEDLVNIVRSLSISLSQAVAINNRGEN